MARIDIIQDIIASGKSILMLGRPGVGKTTMLREAARMLAGTRASAWSSSTPPTRSAATAMCRIRRWAARAACRWRRPARQHEVMIEAVENHNPEVIVIDEIGRELEAEAARTIAERGVQLIGTAHGHTLENLLLNPTLSDLVGGIESVTLSDEEARRRGTQKTVLERRAPPTFDVLIEIHDRHKLLVHHDVSEAVDALLRNRAPVAELRYRDEDGRMRSEKVRLQREEDQDRPREDEDVSGDRRGRGRGTIRSRNGRDGRDARSDRFERGAGEQMMPVLSLSNGADITPVFKPVIDENAEGEDDVLPLAEGQKPLRIYAFGVSKHRLKQAARQLSVPALFVDTMSEADVLITAKSYYRQRPRTIIDAEQDNVPIYVLRSNSSNQMESCLADLFGLTETERMPYENAMEETEEAIRRVLAGERVVDLTPQNAFVRRQQHQLARSSNLVSHSYGKEPMRRVRIFRE